MLIQPYNGGKDPYELANPHANLHRSFFRGKNLGSVYTDEQKEAIRTGTFDDIFIGDYWEINGHTWRVADINYWYGRGSDNVNFLKTNHVAIVPDKCLYEATMNGTSPPASTLLGYYGSTMHSTGLDQAKEMINEAFGENFVLSYLNLLCNGASGGYARGAAFYTCTVELMNEVMVYGAYIEAAMGPATNTNQSYRSTIDERQLALFRLSPRFMISDDLYWLRDVASEEEFTAVSSYGQCYHGPSYGSGGVRPVFGITGENIGGE